MYWVIPAWKKKADIKTGDVSGNFVKVVYMNELPDLTQVKKRVVLDIDMDYFIEFDNNNCPLYRLKKSGENPEIIQKLLSAKIKDSIKILKKTVTPALVVIAESPYYTTDEYVPFIREQLLLEFGKWAHISSVDHTAKGAVGTMVGKISSSAIEEEIIQKAVVEIGMKFAMGQNLPLLKDVEDKWGKLSSREHEIRTNYGLSDNEALVDIATGVFFYESPECYYLLTTAHLTNRLQRSKKEFDVFHPKILLSNGMKLEGETIIDNFDAYSNRISDVAIVKVRKSNIPKEAISVIPLAELRVLFSYEKMEKGAVFYGYAREGFKKMQGKYILLDPNKEIKIKASEESIPYTGFDASGFCGGPIMAEGKIIGIVHLNPVMPKTPAQETYMKTSYYYGISVVGILDVFRMILGEKEPLPVLEFFIDEADRLVIAAVLKQSCASALTFGAVARTMSRNEASSSIFARLYMDDTVQRIRRFIYKLMSAWRERKKNIAWKNVLDKAGKIRGQMDKAPTDNLAQTLSGLRNEGRTSSSDRSAFYTVMAVVEQALKK